MSHTRADAQIIKRSGISEINPDLHKRAGIDHRNKHTLRSKSPQTGGLNHEEIL